MSEDYRNTDFAKALPRFLPKNLTNHPVPFPLNLTPHKQYSFCTLLHAYQSQLRPTIRTLTLMEKFLKNMR